VRRTGHAESLRETRNAYNPSVGCTEWKRQFGRPVRGWDVRIRAQFISENTEQWQALLTKVMHILGCIKIVEFLIS
jgi:hypothetical protein